jgi:NADPH-dependent glutamate synthase beta subunit-like oxidoreductase
VLTKEFLGLGTRVRGLRCVRIAWSEPDAARHVESPAATGRRSFHEAPDSGFRLEADLVILALGFVHAEAGPLVQDLGIDLDPRGNLRVDEEFRTRASGVFAAGDAVAGASLVVRAINQGRRMAEAVDRFLRSA